VVMNSYMEHGGSGRAWDDLPMIPAPPGTSLGDMPAQSVFSEVTTALGLSSLGIYTPWASRTGDTNWDEIKSPDTNIVLWGLNDAQLNAVTQLSFGSPLPFVAVLTKVPLTQTAVAAMWDGTAYAPYETQAVYRQDDAKGVPTIFFLHWGERIDMAQLPKQTLAIGPRASAALGMLVFAAQVPVQGTTSRPPPASPSFQDALQSQMMANAPVTASPSTQAALAPATPAASASSATDLSLPIAIGLGAATLTYLLWRGGKR